MKTDRELLELAAKAAGVGTLDRMTGSVQPDGTRIFYNDCEGKTWRTWNPLTDDGDALRLAVKLRLNLNFEEWDGVEYACVVPHKSHQGQDEVMGDDENAATRRAIVRAAAAIGEGHDQ